MTSAASGCNDHCLLLATDVAGVIHCYRYTTEKGSIDDSDDDEPVAVLTHLWSRSLSGKIMPSELLTPNDSSTNSPVPSSVGKKTSECAEHAGFRCIISKPLRRLQAASIVHPEELCRAPRATNFASAQKGVSDSRGEMAYDNPTRGARRKGTSSDATTSKKCSSGQRTRRGRCLFCSRTSPSPSSPTNVDASPCLPSTSELCVMSDDNASQTPTVAAASTTPSLYCRHKSDRAPMGCRGRGANTESDEDLCDSDAGSRRLFNHCDFMARVKETMSLVVDDRGTAQSAVARDLITSLDPASSSLVRVSSHATDVAWYWRCPQSILDTRSSLECRGGGRKRCAQKESARGCEMRPLSIALPEEEVSDSGEHSTSPFLWMSLPEAVQHWNTICCHRHRLLLLHHMEEQYMELDLFTGASLSCVALTDAVDSTATTPMTESLAPWSTPVPSGQSCISNGSGEEGRSSDTLDIADAAATHEPLRAVLSLTTQHFSTLVMQAPIAPIPEKRTRWRNTARKESVAPPGKPSHRCLAKLTAPVVKLGVTLHAPRQEMHEDLFVANADATAMGEGNKIERLWAPQCPSVRPFSSSGSSDTSLPNSTSASDIDIDILSGRKRIPPRHHSTRLFDSASVSPDSSNGSPRKIADDAVSPSRVTRAKQNCTGMAKVADASPGHWVESRKIPVRCGPGGCVYSSLASEHDYPGTPTNSETLSTSPPPFLLLLQLPLPLVEAFWVTLPPTSAPRGPSHDKVAKELWRADTWSTAPVEVQEVPWISSEACSVRAFDASTSGRASTAGSLSQANGSATLITLRGFILEVPEVSLTPDTVSTGFPRVLRTLSAYDLLYAREGALRGAPLVDDTGEKIKPLGASGTGKREEAVMAAGVSTVCSHICSTSPVKSTASSSSKKHMKGASVTHSISSPPHHYIPSTSFFDENFVPLALLGRGVGGAALLVQHRFTDILYAIKVMVIRDYESERDILQEMRVHAMLENRYVVRYHTCWSEVISATRAQQLALIGVCHPSEAKMIGFKRLNSVSSLSPATNLPNTRSSAWYPRTTSQRDLLSESKLRCAPVGWKHLELPRRASMVLVGSESFSETETSIRSPPRLRSNAWSTAIVDECAHYTTDEEEGWNQQRSDATRHEDSQAVSCTETQWQASQPPLASCEISENPLVASVLSCSSCSTPSTTAGRPTEEEASDKKANTESLWDGTQGLASRSWSSSDISNSDTASEYSSRQRNNRHSIVGSRVVFLQMELCQMTLAQYLASRASISRVENIIILLQLVSGLRYLHDHGILHRDMKPTNVFIDYRCQFDKSLYQMNSSGASDDNDVLENEDHLSSPWENQASPTPPCGSSQVCPSAGSDGACTSPSSSALALCPRHVGERASVYRSSAFNSNVSYAPWDSSTTLPGMKRLLPAASSSLASVWGAMSATTSLDRIPSWDGERKALDYVTRQPHRLVSEMLHDRLLRRPPPPLPPAAAAAVSPLTSSLSSVQRSNSRHYIRRLANWLLHRFVRVRLGDFGLAKFIYQQQLRVDDLVSMNTTNTVGVGSPLYASPEQLKGNRCTAASDAFSVGVVLAEMYIQPKTIAERLTVLREVREGFFGDSILSVQFPEVELALRLTVSQPERRMSLEALHKALEAFLEQALHDEVYRHHE